MTAYLRLRQKFVLINYVLGFASDAGCCMKSAKTIGDSQKSRCYLIVHAWAFCGVGIVSALAVVLFHGWIHLTMNGCAHAVA